MDFDSGDDRIEMILLCDFFARVLHDLGMDHLSISPNTKTKVEKMLAQIGALAYNMADPDKIKVVRFDILRSAWQVHGYEFSNLKQLKTKQGMNFNMLSVKSIRILNRFTAKIAKYKESYVRKLEQ